MKALLRPTAGVDGFTLIELMIAVVILAVAILGMASVLAETSKWQSRSESSVELTSAAEGKLEELRDVALAKAPDTVQLVPGGSKTTPMADHADSLATGEGRWIVRRWEVVAGPGAARTVHLRVVHRDQGERTISARDFSTVVLLGK